MTTSNNNRPPANGRPPVQGEPVQTRAATEEAAATPEEEEERQERRARTLLPGHAHPKTDSQRTEQPYGYTSTASRPDEDSYPAAVSSYEPPLERGKGLLERADEFMSVVVDGGYDSLMGTGSDHPAPHPHHDHNNIAAPQNTHPALARRGNSGPSRTG